MGRKSASKNNLFESRLTGIFLFISAVFLNPFLMEILLSPDKQFDYIWRYIVIAVFDFILIAVGCLILFKPKIYAHNKKFVFLFFLPLILLFFVIYFILSVESIAFIDSEIFGWDNKASNMNIRLTKDTDGIVRRAKYETFEYGFKLFPEYNYSTNNIKILVIGDSFTEARQVSNGEEYYSYLKNMPSVSIYAKGVSGWGTLQEYLFIREYAPKIRPDIIILQFCANDFINNNYDLSRNTLVQNPGRNTPFLENGAIIFKNPAMLKIPVFENSKMATALDYAYRRAKLRFVPFNETLDYVLIDNFYSVNSFNESINTTFQILYMIQNTTGAEVFSFGICNTNNESVELYNAIMHDAGIQVIENVEESIRLASHSETVYTSDGHWNPRGHEIAGLLIKEHIESFIKNSSKISP